jgi:hypothetical protein
MSTSGSLRPSSRKGSSRSDRICEFGSNHVSRDEYEDCRNQLSASLRDVQTKDAELLQYHNELGEKQESQNHLRALLDKKEAIGKKDRADYNTLVREHNEYLDQGKKLGEELTRTQETLTEAREELRKAKLEVTSLKRTRESEASDDQKLAKRLQTENQDLRNRNTTVERELKDWKTKSFGITPPPPDDLEPLRNLHPGLAGKDAKDLAKELVDILIYNLNDIWSLLPTAPEENLVTPSHPRLDTLLKRLREAVERTSELQLGPKLEQSQNALKRAEKRAKENQLDFEAAEQRENRANDQVQALAREISTWETVFHVFADERNIINASQGKHKLIQLRDALQLAEQKIQTLRSQLQAQEPQRKEQEELAQELLKLVITFLQNVSSPAAP